MEQGNPSVLDVEIKIAGKYTVGNWIELRKKLLNQSTSEADWLEAYNFFKLRIDTRFLKPIEAILAIIPKNDGQGFAACALQCVLIEFLEAFYQGKVYRPPIDKEAIKKQAKRLSIEFKDLEKHKQPNEYTSSVSFFKSFLINRNPYNDFFDNKKADLFYKHFRCGLLHEAATKGGSKIRSKKEGAPDCIVDLTENGIIIYRDAFQKSIGVYLEEYYKQLLQSKLLQTNYICKMDELAQIERYYYFAYGSNLATDQINVRIKYVHNQYKAKLSDYAFTYNKKSTDGTSKANLEKIDGAVTWGVCYEIDRYQFDYLKKKYEQGYDVIEVWVDSDNMGKIIAKTFVSKSLTEANPSSKYVDTIVVGARENQLPDDYIATYLNFVL